MAAADWRECKDPAKRRSLASTALKGLVEADVVRGFCHGVELRRSKAGALTTGSWRMRQPL